MGSIEGLPIIEINIDNGDIFDHSDPEENLWIHRIANKLHINTRQITIANHLLFGLGDAYNEELAEETERLLRSRGYIHDAKITAEAVCGKGVRINVATTDNWTLTPSISASQSGGETRTAIEIEESNFLGYGIGLKILSKSDEDRDTNSIEYLDTNWLGNFKILDIALADNSDGHRYATSLSRPFIQQDSRYAWSVSALSLERENPIFEAGKRVGEVGQETESYSFSYGWSKGSIDGVVHRHSLGFFSNNTDYFTVDDPSIELPEDTDNSYPVYQYSYQKVKYVERMNFRVMGVTEDLRLGTSFGYQFGWKNDTFNVDQPGAVLSLNYDFGRFISSKTLSIVNLYLQHETNDTIDDTGLFDGRTRIYHHLDENNSYLFTGQFQAALNPELFERIEIGGDSGLKGYPIRFQAGERALTMSVERRLYFNAYLWRLVKFGYAVFGEVGSAWDTGEEPVWLSDVGAGFRVASTRQSSSNVLHIDLAFPLTETSDIDNYQLFIEAKGEF